MSDDLASAVERVSREFTNELGNRIKITIEGPCSVSENIEIKTPLDEIYQFKGATLAEAVALAGLWSPPVTTPTPAVEVDPFS